MAYLLVVLIRMKNTGVMYIGMSVFQYYHVYASGKILFFIKTYMSWPNFITIKVQSIWNGIVQFSKTVFQ